VGQIADHREQYDWAFGRAVAALPILAEYLLPLLKVGGQMVAQLGQSGRHDTEQAQPAFDLLGGVVEGIQTVHLPGQDEPRYLVQIKKTASTPARFPRRVGIPKKRPLA
jgi:16S rRNA (guanine527-N7)-methyltransferase